MEELEQESIEAYIKAMHRYHAALENGLHIPDVLELNKIYWADALDYIKKVPSNSVKICVCDPPYFLGMTHNGQRGGFVDLAICKPFFRELYNEIKRILKHNGQVYWFTDWRGYAFYYPLFDAILGCRNMIVWDKMSGPGNFYAFQHELIMFSCVDDNARMKGTNIWRSPGFASGAKATNGEKVHPTQKTLEVVERIIAPNVEPGDIVADFFMGSGTVAMVCRKLGVSYYGCELDELNITTAQRRESEVIQGTFFDKKALPKQEQQSFFNT